MIGRLLIDSLPDEVPPFLRTPEARDQIAELSREPDRSKGTGTPHDEDLNPGHYVDISDDQTTFGVPLRPLPTTRQAYDTALRVNGSNEYKAGYLPYSIVDGWQQLQKDFAYWRVDVVGEQSALSADDREWFAKDRNLHEMLTIRDLGYWSHFVGDGSQPMHASVHYDGWGNYPNTNNFTSQKGFHAYFEGEFVRKYLTDADVKAEIQPYHDCQCSVQDRTVSYLLTTQSQVIPLYELQKRSAFDGRNQDGEKFAAQRLAAAVSELRDMVIDAWRSSANATVGYPPVRVRDVESGRAMPIEELKGLD